MNTLKKYFFGISLVVFALTNTLAQNMSNYITLNVKANEDVGFEILGDSPNDSARVVCGKMDTSFLLSSNIFVDITFTTQDSILTIYGNVRVFSCSFNDYIRSIDFSNNPNLKEISCDYLDSLTSLNVSNNPAITHLSCTNCPKLTVLDISSCSNLTYLNCNNNNLTSLTFPKSSSIFELSCFDNKLTSLNLTNCTSLVSINCSNNLLTSLDVSNNPQLRDISCDNNNLTSLHIHNNYYLQTINCSGNSFTTQAFDDLMCSLPATNGVLYPLYNQNDKNYAEFMASNAKNANAKHWSVEYYENNSSIIDSTTGNFVCNNTYFVDTNYRITLYHKTNKNLQFMLSSNKLDNMARIVNGNLDTLVFLGTYLYYGLNVEEAVTTIYGNINGFECNNNDIDSIDITKNTLLEYLFCRNNNLSSLDVSKHTKLIELDCGENNLTNLDVTKNTMLRSLMCNDCKLTSLNITACSALISLVCSNNQLSDLDLTKNTALEVLFCDRNKLTSLNISTCIALRYLYCNDNLLTELDLSNCTMLRDLSCQNNELTTLNVNKCHDLSELHCNNNKLTSLDLSTNGIGYASIYNNPFTTDVFNDIMCSLPSVSWGTLYVLENDKDTNASIFEASNGNIAIDKGYSLRYAETSNDIPATNGTFTCTPLILDSSEYITLNIRKGENVNFYFASPINNTPIKIKNGNDISYLVSGANGNSYSSTMDSDTLIIYGNIHSFECNYNLALSNVDISTAPSLIELRLYFTNLTSLDISKNIALTKLNIEGNKLTSLDVSNNTALRELNCTNNQLTKLELKNNTNLKEVSCFENAFTTQAFDDIMCSLPKVNGQGIFIPLFSTNDKNTAAFMASNSANAIAKNWQITYARGEEIPATNGSYSCSGGNAITETPNSSIVLYPNPTKTMLNIENVTGNVQIFDITGRVVMSATNNGETLLQINVSNLFKGMYFVKIGNHTTKFIKE